MKRQEPSILPLLAIGIDLGLNLLQSKAQPIENSGRCGSAESEGNRRRVCLVLLEASVQKQRISYPRFTDFPTTYVPIPLTSIKSPELPTYQTRYVPSSFTGGLFRRMDSADQLKMHWSLREIAIPRIEPSKEQVATARGSKESPAQVGMEARSQHLTPARIHQSMTQLSTHPKRDH